MRLNELNSNCLRLPQPILLVIIVGSIINCAYKVNADVPEKPAPPEIAIRALARGEKFLKDLERLSPMIDIADRDKSQMWPRMNSWSRRLPDQVKPIIIERSKETRVVNYAYGDDPRNGPSWTTHFLAGEIRMDVDFQCNKVRSIMDFALSHVLENDPLPDLIHCIDEKSAIARAISYLNAGGIDTNSLFVSQVRLHDKTFAPKSAAEREWLVSFTRHWSGVPFATEQLFVSLDAGKGRLFAYGGSRLALEQPGNKAINITMDKAVQIAESKCKELGLLPMEGSYASLVIALPSDINGDNEEGNKPVLCWNAFVPIQTTLRGQRAQAVRINVTTGEIVGGNSFRTKGGKVTGLPDSGIMTVFDQASKLQISEVEKSDSTLEISPSKITLRYRGALNGFMGPTSTDLKFHASHNVAIFPAQGKPRAFKYDASTGLLQDEAGKCVVVSMPMRAILTSH